MDNLAAAYNVLDHKVAAKGGRSGISASEYIKLVKSLCRDFPEETLDSVLSILDIREQEVISFEEFAAGINTCLYYSDFLEHAEDMYLKCLGGVEDSTVSTQKYLELIRQLRRSDPDLVMPNEEEVAAALGKHGSINFKRFVANVFTLATTVDNLPTTTLAASGKPGTHTKVKPRGTLR